MSVFVIKGIFLSNYTMATAKYDPAVGCKRTLADPKGQLCIYVYIYILLAQKVSKSLKISLRSQRDIMKYIVICRGNERFVE